MSHIIRKIQDAKPMEITCGILRNLTVAEDCKDMDFAHVTITDSTKKHYHKNLTEVYYVLKGNLDVEIDGKIEHLEKGSMIMIHPNTNHKAWKTSKEDAEVLVVCSPPWSEDDEILVE
ncbi:cupin domain-containing protein [Candidatus Woesearchaeota archaeon]|nr:cupin domain-containing protein [Candidatus Woesearchaeota archaeon]